MNYKKLYPTERPFILGKSLVNNTTSLANPTIPNTKHSLIKWAICFFGKIDYRNDLLTY